LPFAAPHGMGLVRISQGAGMKDALVTLIGGGGFLGRYVAQELLRRGARVRVVQRRPRDAWFLKPLGGLGQTQFFAGDVTRAETMRLAIAGSDAVVNLAGTFKPGAFNAVHVEGARTIAEAARAAGAGALVHLSAIGADPKSRAAYGRSKAAGETAVLAAFPGATIIRPSVLFGREDQFVNRFAGMIAGFSVVPILRGGARFQPAYVAARRSQGAWRTHLRAWRARRDDPRRNLSLDRARDRPRPGLCRSARRDWRPGAVAPRRAAYRRPVEDACPRHRRRARGRGLRRAGHPADSARHGRTRVARPVPAPWPVRQAWRGVRDLDRD